MRKFASWFSFILTDCHGAGELFLLSSTSIYEIAFHNNQVSMSASYYTRPISLSWGHQRSVLCLSLINIEITTQMHTHTYVDFTARLQKQGKEEEKIAPIFGLGKGCDILIVDS